MSRAGEVLTHGAAKFLKVGVLPLFAPLFHHKVSITKFANQSLPRTVCSRCGSEFVVSLLMTESDQQRQSEFKILIDQDRI